MFLLRACLYAELSISKMFYFIMSILPLKVAHQSLLKRTCLHCPRWLSPVLQPADPVCVLVWFLVFAGVFLPGTENLHVLCLSGSTSAPSCSWLWVRGLQSPPSSESLLFSPPLLRLLSVYLPVTPYRGSLFFPLICTLAPRAHAWLRPLFCGVWMRVAEQTLVSLSLSAFLSGCCSTDETRRAGKAQVQWEDTFG